MKVIERDPASRSMTVLDPVNIQAILKDASRHAASGVLFGKHLAISTVPCTSHDDTAAACGLDFYHDADPAIGLTEGKGIRLWLTEDCVTAELILFDQLDDDDAALPLDRDALLRLDNDIRNHPRIRAAYGRGSYAVHLAFWNETMDEFRWAWSLDQDGPDGPSRTWPYRDQGSTPAMA
jgi:hypothetical protein